MRVEGMSLRGEKNHLFRLSRLRVFQVGFNVHFLQEPQGH
jgi:hypothetical protein